MFKIQLNFLKEATNLQAIIMGDFNLYYNKQYFDLLGQILAKKPFTKL